MNLGALFLFSIRNLADGKSISVELCRLFYRITYRLCTKSVNQNAYIII